MAQPTPRNLHRLLHGWCACFCPEFTLPLSIWLNGGWNGLLLHWRAGLRATCRMGRPTVGLQKQGVIA
jgi:hypothetical protein